MIKQRTAAKLNAIDLFAGCGGLTQGMHDAGFYTRVAVEIEAVEQMLTSLIIRIHMLSKRIFAILV